MIVAGIMFVADMEQLQGHLLVASPQMQEPNFHRTVILVVRDDDDGTMGLVLNRPLDVSIKTACEKILETPCAVEGVLHAGGPCEGPLMILNAGDAFGAAVGDLEVLPDVWFITNKEEIESLLAEGTNALKCFIGYAGWGAGQLDAEMEAGAWIAHPGTSEHVFSTDVRQWSKLMTQLTLPNEIDPKRIPDDPSTN